MKRPAVLVTGGAGYIGSHTCKALSKAGLEPVVLDNLSTGHAHFVKWGPLLRADIRDEQAVTDAIRQYRIEAVLHFAAHAYVGESVLHPAKYYDNNVVGSLSLMNSMRAADCKKLVFSSTCAIYGEPSRLPIDETVEARPVNPYGASKLMVERIIGDYGKAYGLKASCLRYFNACGADEDQELGEDRNPETHLIPRAMLSLLGHLDDFQVFGTDYDTPDGTAIRDYIHVADLAEAHVAAIHCLLEGQNGISVNLGTGNGYSVQQILDAISAEAGRSLPSVGGSRRPGDPSTLIAGTLQARRVLAFQPMRSDLRTIVKTAWAWHKATHGDRGVVIHR